MNTRRSRPAPSARGVEALEGRVVPSGTATAAVLPLGSAEVASHGGHKASTSTTLSVRAESLGQPITFTATVRAPSSAGSPEGTVNITERGQLIELLPLAPSTSPLPKYATSTATGTITPQPGAGSDYFGQHAVVATFVPAGPFGKSVATRPFVVASPAYSALAGGTKVATVVPGSGPAIQPGQTASVMYTGYLAKNGQIFDDSARDGGAPFQFTVGVGQVVPGFDAGTVGMKVGETRIVEIPPSQGYGTQTNGLIPPNSTLIFVMTLESIS